MPPIVSQPTTPIESPLVNRRATPARAAGPAAARGRPVARHARRLGLAGPGSGWSSPCSAAAAARSTTTSRTASPPGSAGDRTPRPLPTPRRCATPPPRARRRSRPTAAGRRRARAAAHRPTGAPPAPPPTPAPAPSDTALGEHAGRGRGHRRQRRHPGRRAAARLDRDDRREAGDRAADPPAARAARGRRLRAAVQLLLGYDRRPAGRDHRAQSAAHAARARPTLPRRRARSWPAPPAAASPGRATTPTARASTSGPSRSIRRSCRCRTRSPSSPRPSLLWVKVSTEGRTVDVARLRPSNDAAFERAVRNFVWSMTWHPALKDGAPVEAWTQMLFPPAPEVSARDPSRPRSSRRAPPSWATSPSAQDASVWYGAVLRGDMAPIVDRRRDQSAGRHHRPRRRRARRASSAGGSGSGIG